MLTHLEIENFQSLIKADLELRPFTLIVGPNFSGKSAILRALRNLAFNRRGDEFIRSGSDQVSVKLFTDEQAALWTKERGSSASYHLMMTADGKESSWDKTGTDVPEGIVDMLGIRKLDIDANFSITPQFVMQWDNPLVAESGSRMARILGAMTKLDRVVRAQLACRKDRDLARRNMEYDDQRSAEANEKLVELQWIPDARKAVDSLTVTVEEIRYSSVQIDRAELLSVQLEQLESVHSQEDSRIAIESLLPDLTAIDKADMLVGKLWLAEVRIEELEEELHHRREARARTEEEYENECRQRGICDTCPWK